MAKRKTKSEEVGEQLGQFYAEWGRKLRIVTNRKLPKAKRLAALHWIDNAIGERRTPAKQLERITDELLAEGIL